MFGIVPTQREEKLDTNRYFNHTGPSTAGRKDSILLKGTSTFSAPPENVGMQTSLQYVSCLRCEVGLSAHNMMMMVIYVAHIALGAAVIEKHLTLKRADGGVDSNCPVEPSETAQLVTGSARAWHSLLKVTYGPTKGERKCLQYRRSLDVVCDIFACKTLSPKNVRAVRTDQGRSIKNLNIRLSKLINRDVPRVKTSHWDLLN